MWRRQNQRYSADGFEDRKRGPGAKICRQILEARKDRFSARVSREEYSLADIIA